MVFVIADYSKCLLLDGKKQTTPLEVLGKVAQQVASRNQVRSLETARDLRPVTIRK